MGGRMGSGGAALPTGLAAAKEGEVAGIREEAVVAEDTLLQRRQRLVVNLEDGMAALADEMMMRRVAHQLKVTGAGTKVGLRH